MSANLVGNISAPNVDWGSAGGLTLDVNESKTFIVTGTVGTAGCALENVNSAGANYGCGTSDICLGQPVVDSASLQTVPILTIDAINGDLGTCGGDITLVLNNEGPPAQNVVLTDTLPADYVYESTVSATTTPDSYPSDGDNPAVWTLDQPAHRRDDPGLPGAPCRHQRHLYAPAISL